ncbi:MAG: type IV pilin protein [Gammaproteobacteria bacterium]|nr:type IV pilin protein [Gammaproteobacteria bacterium]
MQRGGRVDRRSRRRGAAGITLIELMTVLVIVAIIGAIAVPSYRNYVLRSQRNEATTALLRVQAAQEKFFIQNNHYTDNLSAPPPNGLGIPAVTPGQFYEISLALLAAGTAYRATAVPRAGGGQADDRHCARFSVDQNGVKLAQDAAGTDTTRDCWR